MKIRIVFLIVFLSVFTAFSANVDTVSTYSPSMDKQIKAVVVTPEGYSEKAATKYPVVYMLHGYSGNYKEWVDLVPELQDYADRFKMILVSPDGNYGSWYLDSPEQPDSKFETYISSELVKWIDDHYQTKADKSGRAITGLSMGGHGAFYLAFRHQDVYSQAGSLSGGVDLRPFPLNWDLAKLLGSYAEHPGRWEQNSVINLTHLLTPNSLDLIFSCGTDDFFYQVNENLHEKLLQTNIPHTYVSAPGGHTWEFWKSHVKYHLQFFHENFEKNKS